MEPRFALAVVSSEDGFIARATDDAPQNWASAEEQTIFFQHVEAADWAIMGRNTHEAADKPYRHRIILSRRTSGWQRPTQLWIDPSRLSPGDLPSRVEGVRPLGAGLILGGTTVHDWFLRHAAIDVIYLTIEPVTFGAGLPIFTGQTGNDPEAIVKAAGFSKSDERVLNDAGTLYQTWRPASRSFSSGTG
ncbi:MAG: hypothetical protein AAGF74_18050 [Pseudomonadota bacterium]